ncbi:MAG: hypothetical protein M1839_004785 [Geoglossum umbratile]|nr:MAG: hypothetical protein M1839_004785 [Geoglossum umbratile]
MAPVAQAPTDPLDQPSAPIIPVIAKLGSAETLNWVATLSPVTTSDGDGASTSSVSQTQNVDARVRYIVDFSDTLDNRRITVFSSNEPFNLEPAVVRPKPIAGTDSEGDSSPVIQMHTSAFGASWTKGPTSIKDVSIHSVGRSRVVIFSQALLRALRNVVTYYPSQNLAGDSVTVHEPYSVVIHHLDELKALQVDYVRRKESLSPKPADPEAFLCDEETFNHIQILLDVLEPTVKETIKPAEKRLQKPVPAVVFDDLWLLFKPGVSVYSEPYKDGVEGGIVKEVRKIPYIIQPGGPRGSPPGPPSGLPPPPVQVSSWQIEYWSLVSDGETISRSLAYKTIEQFEGERDITSLVIFPTQYWDAIDNCERRKALEKRGEKLFGLLHVGHKQMYYDGYTNGPRNGKYQGRIIVDVRAALAFSNIERRPSPVRDRDSEQSKKPKSVRQFRWAEYENITVKKVELLSRDHYFLLGSVVSGFALQDKTWDIFHVDKIAELEQEGGLENLVPGDADLGVIKALSYRQRNAHNTWRADFVQGKGEGQIILLHGPPGVGKTYTIECTAEATGRPLICLTIADIGTEAQKTETELVKWFNLAEMWGAILLIDEADIFLERRTHSDLARNGLVSVFLRKMEYFRGLLFLTTNRIGHIDDAFLSRVHVVIGFKRLNDRMRSLIWKGFFDKLKLERKGDVVVAVNARKYVLESDEVKKLQWNGREIRNAFQTSLALAEFEAFEAGNEVVVVESEHFRRVVKMSKAFKTYVDSIEKMPEGKRAERLKDRNDAFDMHSEED